MISKKKNKPTFIISLDTELAWGYIDNQSSIQLDLMKKDPLAVRSCIEKILNMLDKYNIPATWAIVGHLFEEDIDYENSDIYKNYELYDRNFAFVNKLINSNYNSLIYGKDIIENIISRKTNHEIGCHSFSHIDFSKAIHDLNHNPQVSPEEGIQKTVDWMKWYYRLDTKEKPIIKTTM